ncbi:MAG TPA: hypothetical protein EYF95_07175 [Flavobacteriales bacterium]|nr:hypothetical protein [Flavobacteriales bacterium]HIK67734.1 hypothetical protein [Flavobacteriales bacterium]
MSSSVLYADTLSWKAEIIDPSTIEGVNRFSELKHDGSIQTVSDTLENQVAELAIIRNPVLKQDPAGLAKAIGEILVGKDWNTYGCWVVYHWIGSAVRLLPEDEFVEVRTNRNKNRITREEQEGLALKTVGIVGLSVGQAAAFTIAMERSAGTIVLADFDELELSNLNRIRAGVHELGMPKWIVAARAISEVDPFINIEVFPKGVTEKNISSFIEKCNVVIDACDGLAAKALIRLEAMERKIPVIMDTSDRGMLDIERYDILTQDDGFLHGRIDYETMVSLKSRETWTPETLNLFVDFASASEKGRESLALMGTKLVGWPQLHSDVASGGAFAAESCRRLMLGENLPDIRLYIELDEQLSIQDSNF